MSRVFWALLWRELKKGKTTYHVVSYVLPPTLYLLVFGLTMTNTIATKISYQGTMVNYLVFITPGIIALSSLEFERSFAETRLDVATHMFMVLLVSNMRAHHYIASRIASFSIPLLAQVAYLTVLTGILTGYWPPASAIALVIVASILSLILWISIGTVFGLYITSEFVRDIVFIVLGLPLRLFSNVYYPLDSMPTPIRVISLLNPLTYAGRVVRDAYLGIPIPMNMMFTLLLTSMASLVIALHQLSRYRMK